MTRTEEQFRSWIPHGFDFLPPDETARLHSLSQNVRRLFSESGYREIVPPMFDFAPTFQITTHHSGKPPLFEMRDADGANLAVRSDLTVQVIKAVANGRIRNGMPEKLCYFQPVYQDRAWGSGRKRELFQAGVELIGDHSIERIGEMMELARAALTACGFTPRIIYGDVRFLNALFSRIPSELREEFSNAFYYKDTAQIASLCRTANLDAELSALLTEVPLLFGGQEIIEKLKGMCRNHEELLAVLHHASEQKNVIFDFSLVRELSYYTGPVFEAYIPESKKRVVTGGVYDDLFGQFSKENRNACGFALNLSILLNCDGNGAIK